MPRTFRHIAQRRNQEILSIFPMLKSNDWDDHPTLIYRAVSIWDHWLYETNEQHLLEANSHGEYMERCDKFAKLDGLISANTDIYLVSGRPWPRFKELREPDQLINRLSPAYHSGRWMTVLPELKMVYTSGDGDEHTRVTYYQDRGLARAFDQWVEESGLKYIGQCPSTK